MILNPPERTAEKCTFLQRNAGLGGHIAGNRRKSQEGLRAQESRTPANFHKVFSAGFAEDEKKKRKKEKRSRFQGKALRAVPRTMLTHVDFKGVPSEKAPRRNCVTKILPNVRVNFLLRFASKPLFYWEKD